MEVVIAKIMKCFQKDEPPPPPPPEPVEEKQVPEVAPEPAPAPAPAEAPAAAPAEEPAQPPSEEPPAEIMSHRTYRKKYPPLRDPNAPQSSRPFDPSYGDNRPLPVKPGSPVKPIVIKREDGTWEWKKPEKKPAKTFISRETMLRQFENMTGAVSERSRGSLSKQQGPPRSYYDDPLDESVYSSRAATERGRSPKRPKSPPKVPPKSHQPRTPPAKTPVSSRTRGGSAARSRSPPASHRSSDGTIRRKWLAPEPLSATTPKRKAASPTRPTAVTIHEPPVATEPPRCFDCLKCFDNKVGKE